MAWCVDLESGVKSTYMVVTRRSYDPITRPYVEPTSKAAPSSSHRRNNQPQNGPTANKASVGNTEDCVLLDTGANEVARTGHGPKPTRSKLSPLQLADGSQVEAWRTRDGDIFVESSRLIRARMYQMPPGG